MVRMMYYTAFASFFLLGKVTFFHHMHLEKRRTFNRSFFFFYLTSYTSRVSQYDVLTMLSYENTPEKYHRYL